MKYFLVFGLILTFSFYLTAQNNSNVSDTTLAAQVLGEVNDTVQSEGFFETEVPLKITLKYDITSFIKNKSKAEYMDAELIVYNNNETPVTKNIRIMARGNFRKGQCYFPPLFLNFKTDEIERTELKGINKIKVVTHCTTGKNNDNIVLKEYLAYKLYNVLTEKSFRVRLADITYIDTGKKQHQFREMGFIIEPVELVAKRNNCVLIDPIVVRGVNIVEEDADRSSLFQYMISNTDWRFKGGHNTKYMKSLTEITPQVIPVPYDFDFSAFVDASYAFPQSWSTSESLFERDYLGYCRDNDENYLKTIRLFAGQKEKIMNTIATFSYLPEGELKDCSKFIGGFFDNISNEKSIVNTIKNQCRPIDF
jgi:hypothetical protein